MIKRGVLAALVGMCLGLCCGCGAGQRAEDSQAAAARFLAAVDGGDTRAACALLATDTRAGLEYAEGRPCAETLVSVGVEGGTVGDVTVWGDRARARTSNGTLFLVELDGGWRVAAAGCTRTGDGPYDCLLAA